MKNNAICTSPEFHRSGLKRSAHEYGTRVHRTREIPIGNKTNPTCLTNDINKSNIFRPIKRQPSRRAFVSMPHHPCPRPYKQLACSSYTHGIVRNCANAYKIRTMCPRSRVIRVAAHESLIKRHQISNRPSPDDPDDFRFEKIIISRIIRSHKSYIHIPYFVTIH